LAEQRKAFLPHMRWCADELAALLGQLMAYDLAIAAAPSRPDDQAD
jgi:hypothetical protein